MTTISKRVLITSLTTAVLASSTLASATVIRLSPAPVLGRPVLNAQPYAIPARPFANSTPRTVFVAGGATLPALAYEGTNALTRNPSTPVAGSIFGYFSTLAGVATQYCQTGSGFGKKVFDGLPGATGGVNGPCPAIGASPTASNGFGAAGSLGLTDPDVTGSDSPLSQAEYSQFVSAKAHTRGQAVELPAIIGSVALLYNDPDLGTSKLNLSDSQICALVEGKVTNWSQLGKPSRALFVAFRSDGSGTTISFSNHLLKACGTGSKLSTSQNFAATGSPPLPAPWVFPGGTVPLNFVGGSGNGGVVAAVKAHVGAIGYVEAANAKAAVGGAVQFATVNGKDPVKNLPEAAQALVYNGTNIAPDSAVVVNTGVGATTSPLTGVGPIKGCVQLVKPTAYGTSTKGYPILAVTYFLFSTAGEGTNASKLLTLVNEVNTPANFGPHINTVNAPTTASNTGTTGYAALPSSFNGPLESIAKTCNV